MDRSPQVLRRTALFAQGAGLGAGFLGALALIGWFQNIAVLKSIIPGAAPLDPTLAAGLLLCGGSLAMLARKNPARPLRIGAAALALIAIGLGAVALLQHFSGWNFEIPLFSGSTGAAGDPTHMAPATVFCFLLAGGALFTASLSITKRLHSAFITGLSAAVLIIGALPLTGFFLESAFGPRWNYLGMSVSGVTGGVGFMLLGSGLLALLQGQRALWSLDAFTTAGFALGVLLMVAAAALAFIYTRQMLETTTLLSHRQEVLKKIQEISTDVSDLQKHQRVFIILGDKDFLVGREQTQSEIRQDLLDVRKLTADNQNQQRRLDQLELLVEQRIAWEERLITVRRDQGFPAAAELVGTRQGLVLSEKLQRLLLEMGEEEYRLLALAKKQAERASITAFSLLPLGVFLSLAILSLGLAFLNVGVTEQKQAEKALRGSEAQLQTIVENLDEGVVVADLEGRLLHWNRAALHVHGYSSSEQDRRHFPDLVDTLELSTLDGRVLPVEEWPLARILRDKKLHNLEVCLRRFGSDWERIVDYGGTLVHDEEGDPLLAITTVTDITERKRAERRLRHSEEGMRAILESALDSIITMDHHGRIVEFNPAAEETFGYQRKEVTGQFLADLIIPESLRERHRNGLSHYLATGEGPVLGKRIEMTAMRADRSEFPVELAINRVGSQEPPMFTGFIRDITERKHAEETLQASEERYRTLFESNPSPMWVYDLETLSFLAVNTAATRHYGYSKDEFLAMSIKDVRPAEDVPALLENLRQRTRGLDDVSQWRHRKKDGSLIDVEVTSHELAWLGRPGSLVLVNDITARKRAEGERSLLAAIVESSEDAIIGTNVDGIITSWNRGAEKLFGYAQKEVIGKSILMLFPPERVHEERAIISRIRQGATAETFETVRLRKNGSQVHVSVTLSPIRDSNGNIVGASKIVRDNTRQKRAEAEIQQLNLKLEERVRRRTAELESANKELEAFSYSVSHDLRSPLRTVDGFSQAVLEDYGAQLPEDARRLLQTIRQGAQRMGVLIDDLLTFSRLGRLPLQRQAVDMERAARETLQELEAREQDRTIHASIARLPRGYGDPALLKQVWVNLISNAIKYTGRRDKAIIEIGCRGENGTCAYFVSDNGAGFDMQYVHKLFGVFQRLHRVDEFEGTGVGLAIVQRIIHRHGGRVWAEAEEGKGATFYFTLEENTNI